MRSATLLAAIVLGSLLHAPACGQPGRPHLVREPLVRLEGRGLETQLLYGEQVTAYEERKGRRRVAAVEQPEFSHNRRWEGYPGWVRNDALVPMRKTAWWDGGKGRLRSCDWVVACLEAAVHRAPSSDEEPLVSLWLGTRLVGAGDPEDGWIPILLLDGTSAWIATERVRAARPKLSLDERRAQILETARLLLGRPYLWGGRSPAAPDCSGLVNLSYRASGVDIPRDAHEQSLRAEALRPGALKPADLVFTSRARNPKHMSHVMLYAGDGRVIEAERSGVREVSFETAVGLSLDQIEAGERKSGRVGFGRYLR